MIELSSIQAIEVVSVARVVSDRLSLGRNEVYGIRDQRPKKGRDQGSQPRDLESQRMGSGSAVFFMESGIRLTTKTGSGIKILVVFGIRDQHFG